MAQVSVNVSIYLEISFDCPHCKRFNRSFRGRMEIPFIKISCPYCGAVVQYGVNGNWFYELADVAKEN